MTLDPRFQVCWQIFFAVKLSDRVYEMTVVLKSLTSGPLGKFQLIPSSESYLKYQVSWEDSGTHWNTKIGHEVSILPCGPWWTIHGAYPSISLQISQPTHQGAGCVSPLLFSSSRFNCPDKMGDRDMTNDSKPLDTANLMSNMPTTLAGSLSWGRSNSRLSIHQKPI